VEGSRASEPTCGRFAALARLVAVAAHPSCPALAKRFLLCTREPAGYLQVHARPCSAATKQTFGSAGLKQFVGRQPLHSWIGMLVHACSKLLRRLFGVHCPRGTWHPWR
jgi:hypothetical protein